MLSGLRITPCLEKTTMDIGEGGKGRGRGARGLIGVWYTAALLCLLLLDSVGHSCHQRCSFATPILWQHELVLWGRKQTHQPEEATRSSQRSTLTDKNTCIRCYQHHTGTHSSNSPTASAKKRYINYKPVKCHEELLLKSVQCQGQLHNCRSIYCQQELHNLQVSSVSRIVT